MYVYKVMIASDFNAHRLSTQRHSKRKLFLYILFPSTARIYKAAQTQWRLRLAHLLFTQAGMRVQTHRHFYSSSL